MAHHSLSHTTQNNLQDFQSFENCNASKHHLHPCALCIHLCFNQEKNTIPGTESMHELMLSIFNIKLEANEVSNLVILVVQIRIYQVSFLESEYLVSHRGVLQLAIWLFKNSPACDAVFDGADAVLGLEMALYPLPYALFLQEV